MDEFYIITEYLQRLSGTMLMHNDTATLPRATDAENIIVSKDVVVEGIHCFNGVNPSLFAEKALRVNLSDIASSGGRPLWYMLGLSLGSAVDDSWVSGFAEGLGRCQSAFGLDLLGGDTTRANCATSTVSVTIFGATPAGKELQRIGAQIGDRVYVSGSIGDAALALRMLQSGKEVSAYLHNRYLLPEPRVRLGRELVNWATACVDISDGLLQDAAHICSASGVGMDIQSDLIPLSADARALISTHNDLIPCIFSGGDDYELLFTIPDAHANAFESWCRESELGCACTCIGAVTPGASPRLLGAFTQDAGLPSGYRHTW